MKRPHDVTLNKQVDFHGVEHGLAETDILVKLSPDGAEIVYAYLMLCGFKEASEASVIMTKRRHMSGEIDGHQAMVVDMGNRVLLTGIDMWLRIVAHTEVVPKDWRTLKASMWNTYSG